MRAFCLSKAFLGIVLFGFLCIYSSENFPQTGQRELVFLNWDEYIDPTLVEKFEAEFDAKVNEAYYESDDLRDDLLLETDTEGYDLVIVGGISLHTYRKQDWLAPVDEKKVPNVRLIHDRWRDAFPDARKYAVPYFWGTLGIGYRADLVEAAPTSWMDLFQPAESLRGKVGMVRTARDLIGMALKALGYSANSSDPKTIEEAERLLLAQKPYVNTYTYVELDENSELVSGDIAMSFLYSGDALMVQEHEENIRFVVPKEGGNIWVDYLVVMEKSKNKDLAWAFINFLNKPENAAQLAEFVYYPTPNTAAEELLPAEFLEDKVIYPDQDVISRSEFYKPIAARAQKKRNMVFTRIIR